MTVHHIDPRPGWLSVSITGYLSQGNDFSASGKWPGVRYLVDSVPGWWTFADTSYRFQLTPSRPSLGYVWSDDLSVARAAVCRGRPYISQVNMPYVAPLPVPRRVKMNTAFRGIAWFIWAPPQRRK